MPRHAPLRSLLLCATVASGLCAADAGREVPIGRPGDCTLVTAPGDTATAKPVGGLLSIAYDVAVDRAHRVGHQTQRIGGFRILLAEPVAVSADEARVAFAACGADEAIQVRPLLVDGHGEELSYSPHEADLLLTGGRGTWRDWRTCAFTVSEAGGAQQDIYEASGGDGNAWPDGQLTFVGLEVRLVGSGNDAARARGELTVGRLALRGAALHEDDPACYADALLSEAGRFRIGIQTRAAFQGPPIHEEVREIDYDPADPLSRGRRLVLPDGNQRLSWIRVRAERQGAVAGEWDARWERNQPPSASPAVQPVDPALPPPAGRLRINPLAHTGGVYAAGEAQRVTVRAFRGGGAAELRWTITPLATAQVLAEGTAAIAGDGPFQDVAVEVPAGIERSALALHAELTVDGTRVDHADYQFGRAPAAIAPYTARTGMLRGRDFVKRQPYVRTTYLPPEGRPFADDDAAVKHFADMLEQTASVTPYVTYMIDVSEFEVLPGVFDTDRLDRLMDAAADRGCALTIRFAHTQQSPYRWHPYTRPRNWDGAAAKGHAFYGAYAVADEEFIGHWLRAMEVVHARYARHPAFQGYYLMQPSGEWNVPDQPWNGTITGYAWVEADGFRRYLRETLQLDLAQLNGRWGTAYAAWDAVSPPVPDFLRGTKPDLRRQWLDFCRYKQSLEDGWFPRVCRTIRAYDPDHVLIVYGGQQGNGTAQRELLATADFLHNGGNHFLQGEEGLVPAWDRGLGWITEPHHPHRWAAYGDPAERGWVLDWSVFVMTAQAGAGGANMHVYYMPQPSLDLVAHQGGFNALDRFQQYRPILNELHGLRLVETPKQVAVIQDDETLYCKHATVFHSRAEDLRRWFELLKADSVPFEPFVPDHAAGYKLLVLNPLDEVMSGDSLDTVERLVKDGATVLVSGRAGRYCPDAGTAEYPLLRRLGIAVPTGDYRTLDDHAAATAAPGSALFPGGGAFPFYSQADNARDLQDPVIGAHFSLWPYRWIPRSDYFGHFAGAKPGGDVLASFADGGAAVTAHAVGKGRAVVCWGTPRADAPELAGFMSRLAAWCGVVDPGIGRPIPRMLEARNAQLDRNYALLYQERAGAYTVPLPSVPDGEWFVDDMVSSQRFGTYTGAELRKAGLPLAFAEGMPPLKVLRLMPRKALGDTPWIDKLRTPVPTPDEGKPHAMNPVPAPLPSFRDFDARARAGGPLTVVFFGCSLTWGANSTDPQEASYRAHIARRLAERYPAARWRFVDAAIGGTDSRLGAFRFDRDVARHQPDLVFVDFTLNDEPLLADPDHLASYEAIIRRCVGELQVPTVQVLLCAKEMVACLDLERFRTRTAHLAIADAYGCAVGDAFARMQELHRAGRLDLDAVWDNPADPCHPGDAGYRQYADAAWAGFTAAIDGGLVGRMPVRPLHGETYARTVRSRLAVLAPLPAGWTAGKPTRIAAWYDSLMSRWLDDEAVGRTDASGRAPAAWELRVRGATILLYGEATADSGRVRVLVDGLPSPLLPGGILDCRSAFGGAVKLSVAVALGLDDSVEHALRLEPLADPAVKAAEWRIESVCVAGADPQVLPTTIR